MKSIKITIRNGKILTEAAGYTGSNCVAPLEGLKDALSAVVHKEEVTEEGLLPDATTTTEDSQELHA